MTLFIVIYGISCARRKANMLHGIHTLHDEYASPSMRTKNSYALHACMASNLAWLSIMTQYSQSAGIMFCIRALMYKVDTCHIDAVRLRPPIHFVVGIDQIP